ADPTRDKLRDDDKVGVVQDWAAVKIGKGNCSSATLTVAVIKDTARHRVVDNAIGGGLVCQTLAVKGGRRQSAGCCESCEDILVQPKRVGSVEIGEPVDIGRRVERGVEDKSIHAAAAGQDVVAGPAVENIVAGVTDDRVRQVVTGAVDIADAG